MRSHATDRVVYAKYSSTVYLTKHLKISSNSYIERITHMQMLVPRCYTSQLHLQYTSVSSNESDVRVSDVDA